MQNRQLRMDRCNCWGTTRIVLEIQHCPSMSTLVRAEFDKIVLYALDNTNLPKFGKPHFSVAEFVKEEKNDVSSVSTKANA